MSAVKDNHEALNLIEKMIGSEPSLRPTASAVLKHPLFWSKDKCLTFLQDVSDRVDKEDSDSALLASLERNRYGDINFLGTLVLYKLSIGHILVVYSFIN